MKIRRLEISNFKGARHVQVYARDDVNEIAGPNGSGKTSVLDAVVAALAGKRNIDPKPLSIGATKGHVELDLGDLMVRRTFTERGGGTLTVTASDGGKLGQRHLDSLLGEFTFDPLAFSGLGPDQQAAKLRELAGPEWNLELTDYDLVVKDLEEMRRDLGRDIKKFGALPDLKPVEPVDVGELMAELAAINTHNDGVRDAAFSLEQMRRTLKAAKHELSLIEDRVEQLSGELVRARSKASLQRTACYEMERSLEVAKEELPELLSNADVNAKIAHASEINAQAEAYAANEVRREELRALTKTHAAAEMHLAKMREERAQHLRKVPMPLPGLELTADGVAMDGVPLQQLNKSKRLLVGAAIGHAVSGELKICMIREDGANLVGETWTDLLSWCAENDVQLWVETAGDGHSEDALLFEEAGFLERYDDDAEL